MRSAGLLAHEFPACRLLDDLDDIGRRTLADTIGHDPEGKPARGRVVRTDAPGQHPVVPGTIQHLARVAILHGGMPGAEAWRLTYEQLRGELVASGEMGQNEVDETLALLSDTEFTFISQILMAAWARRPEA